MTDQNPKPNRATLLSRRLVEGQWVDANPQVEAERLGRALRGGDILTLDEVAAMLNCNKDYLYRLDRSELPMSKIGKRLFCMRQDVLRLVDVRKAAIQFKLASLQAAPRSRGSIKVFDPVGLVNKKASKDHLDETATKSHKSRPLQN